MEKLLDGVKVVVTRAKEQAGSFASILEEKGATVILFPTIEFKEPEDSSAIDDALNRLTEDKNAFDWIIFTSANGVDFFFKRLEESGKNQDVISSLNVGAVGPKTAAALEMRGVDIDLVPGDYRAEGLIKELLDTGISGKKVLLPRALVGRDILPETLISYGASVILAPVYETVMPEEPDKEDFMNAIKGEEEVVLTFTSGSTVINFFRMFSADELESFINDVKIAAISPVTAEIVEELGYQVDIVPMKYTARNLADVIGREI